MHANTLPLDVRASVRLANQMSLANPDQLFLLDLHFLNLVFLGHRDHRMKRNQVDPTFFKKQQLDPKIVVCLTYLWQSKQVVGAFPLEVLLRYWLAVVQHVFY